MPLRLGLDKLNPQYLEPLIRALRIKQCVGMIGGKPAHSLFFVGSQGQNLLYLDPHTVQPAAIERTVAETKAAVNARKQCTYSSTSTASTPVSTPHDTQLTTSTAESQSALSADPPAPPNPNPNPNPKPNPNSSSPPSPRSSEMYLLPTDDDVATYRCSDVKLMPARDIDPSLAIGFFCQSRLDFDMLCNRIAELKEYGLPMLNVMLKRPNYDDLMGGFDDDDDDDGDCEDVDSDGCGLAGERGGDGGGSAQGNDGDEDDDEGLDKFEDAVQEGEESHGVLSSSGGTSARSGARAQDKNNADVDGDEFVLL
jgi:cysteine protease ATG4